MLTSRTLYRKTKRGSIIKIVREHYLRDDLYCGHKRCGQCYQILLQNPYTKTLTDRICIDQDARKQLSKLVPDSHVVVLDVDILVNQIDVVEDPQFGTNVLILQSVLNVVRQKSLNIHSRVKTLIGLQRNFYLFDNEHHKDTFLPQLDDETSHSYQRRLISHYCIWLSKHWSSLDIKIVILTGTFEDSAELSNAILASGGGRVMCLTLKKYVECMVNNVNVIDKLVVGKASETGELSDGPSSKFIYPKHLSCEETRSGIKAGKYHQGKFQASRDNSLEGFVSITLNNEDVRILIQGRESINRAMQDDVVVIEILPESMWKSTSDIVILPDATGRDDVVDEGDRDQENMLLAMSQANKDSLPGGAKRPTGKVVSIVKRSWRQYCGSLRLKSESLGQTSKFLFVPNERRIPVIRIETRQYEILKGQRLVVAIDSWPRESKYPLGHYVRALGEIGDKETENQVLLLEHDVPHQQFSKAVLDCLPRDGADWKIPEEEYSKRTDLRHLPICSVDPPGCTDIDDALHCKDLGQGICEVGVHIADVSYFVRPKTALDLEAANRGTTVYLVDKRIDMIPALLSSNLCSLIQKQDRLAFSVIWTIRNNQNSCEIIDTKFMRSIINSKASLTYEEAQLMIDSKGNNGELHVGLRNLNQLAKKLKRKRMENGALVLARADEIRFIEIDSETHENDATLEIQHKRMIDTNSLVEEFMLLANISVATKLLEDFPELALLRRHPKPSKGNFDELIEAARLKGFNIQAEDGKHLSESLDKAKLPNNEFFNLMLRMIATRCMTPATYFCSGCGDKSANSFTHFGLAANIYTHFTSPIRRYADLLVHHLLAHAIGSSHLERSMLSKERIQTMCDQINYRHRMAQLAGRASTKLHTVLYIRSKKCLREKAYIFYVRQNALQILIPRLAYEHTYFLNPINDWVYDATKRTQTYKPSKNRIVLSQFDNIEVVVSLVDDKKSAVCAKICLCKNDNDTQRHQVSKLLIDYCLTHRRRTFLIKLIEKKTIDIDTRLDNYGRNLLHRSAYNLDVELVKILIDHNVDVRMRDWAGNTALHISIQSYRNGVIIFDSGPTVMKNLTAIIELLVKADHSQRKANRLVTRCKIDEQNTIPSTIKPHDQVRVSEIGSQKHDRANAKMDFSMIPCKHSPRSKSSTTVKGNLVEPRRLFNDDNVPIKCSLPSQEPKLNDKMSLSDVAFSDASDTSSLPHMTSDLNTELINIRNAFGRSALHYCAISIADNHLSHFVELLLDYGADPDAVDNKLKTPFYCLVKRPDIHELATKCDSMNYLIAGGCDHLGLAFTPFHKCLTTPIDASVSQRYSNIFLDEQHLLDQSKDSIAPKVQSTVYKRVCDLKHLCRVVLVCHERNHDYPLHELPITLQRYIRRRLIDQSEFI
ncbi:Exosome complex exonuclease RRP44, partial [Fragariocoptes setiger]